MRNVILSLVSLLAAAGAACAEELGPSYQIELFIHQGPKLPKGHSLVSRPTMYLLAEQAGQVASGQQVQVNGENVNIGLVGNAEVRPSKQGLVLSLRVDHSELLTDAAGNPQISAQQVTFEKPVKLNTRFAVQHGPIGEKTIWVEVRVKQLLR